MSDARPTPPDDVGGPGAKRGRIRAADLLELSPHKIDDGHPNRTLLGILERSIRHGYIDLVPVDVDDLADGLAKLAKSQNERVAVAARRVQAGLLSMNAKLVMDAEKLAQNERLAESRLPPAPGQTPQTVIVIKEGGQAAIAVGGQQAPPPPPPPKPPEIGDGGVVRLEL